MRHAFAALAVLATTGPALAQQPDQTGTGGGPASTITAPNTTSTGVTKPPGDAEGPATPSERRERSRIEREDDKIDSGICIGCNR